MLRKIISLLPLIQIWNSFAKGRMPLFLFKVVIMSKSTGYEILKFVCQSQFEI